MQYDLERVFTSLAAFSDIYVTSWTLKGSLYSRIKQGRVWDQVLLISQTRNMLRDSVRQRQQIASAYGPFGNACWDEAYYLPGLDILMIGRNHLAFVVR